MVSLELSFCTDSDLYQMLPVNHALNLTMDMNSCLVGEMICRNTAVTTTRLGPRDE
jgi:hypothetical protein